MSLAQDEQPARRGLRSRTMTSIQAAQSVYAEEARTEAAMLGQWGQF